MREIKFRAWDTENEEMAKVIHLGVDDLEVTMEDEECRIWNRPYPYIARLMQWTGLKDKNGVEIYEGDIIKDCEGKIKKVVWKHNGFKLEYTFKRKYEGEEYKETTCLEMGHTDDRRWGCEVIGNIFENRELLEE